VLKEPEQLLWSCVENSKINFLLILLLVRLVMIPVSIFLVISKLLLNGVTDYKSAVLFPLKGVWLENCCKF
jgi:hypothetical protein